MIYNGLHGDTYTSLQKLADAYGIPRGTLKSRLEIGMTLEEALTSKLRKLRKLRNNKCVDWLDNEYDTIEDMCKAYNVKVSTFKWRIKHGYSLQEALTVKVKQMGTPKEIDIPGYGHFKSIKEACEYFGTPYKTYAQRISKGMDKIRAITLDYLDYNDNNGRHPSFGKSKYDKYAKKLGCESFEQLCSMYNQNKRNLMVRLKRNPDKIEYILKAVVDGTLDTGKSCAIKCNDGFGNQFESYWVMCKAYGINYGTVKLRILHRCEMCVALVSRENIKLLYIGLDGKARYKLRWSDEPQTAREVVEYYRPDLLDNYDRYNPTGKYKLYIEDNKDTK